MDNTDTPGSENRNAGPTAENPHVLAAKLELVFPCWEIGWGWMGVEYAETRKVLEICQQLETLIGTQDTWEFALAMIQSFSYLVPNRKKANDSATMDEVSSAITSGEDPLEILVNQNTDPLETTATLKNFLEYLKDYSILVCSRTGRINDVDIEYISHVIGLVKGRIDDKLMKRTLAGTIDSLHKQLDITVNIYLSSKFSEWNKPGNIAKVLYRGKLLEEAGVSSPWEKVLTSIASQHKDISVRSFIDAAQEYLEQVANGTFCDLLGRVGDAADIEYIRYTLSELERIAQERHNSGLDQETK